MKKTILLCALCVNALIAFAQKETLDIVTYTPPNNWQKEVTENITSYTFINKNTGSWCKINIVKSTTSKGNIDADFESEWQELIVKNYNPTDTPQLNEVQESEGWKIKSGTVKFLFNNNNAIAILTTASGFERCASIVAVTNSQDFTKDIEALLSSAELTKPTIITAPTVTNSDENNSILGTWGASASDQSSFRVNNGVMNYIVRQYTFNDNGTYTFYTKTFDPLMDKILLGKENGTFEISGNSITVNPQKSVLEAWSKKDGKDEWGKKLNSQNIALEKVIYQFTKHYFSGIHLWNLVLQNDKITQRDGPHSSNTTFSNAWYYSPISANNPVIELPGGQKIVTAEVKNESLEQTANNNNTSILRTWCMSASDNSNYRVKNGVVSTIFRQYTFNANGSYGCNIKTFDPLLNSTFLERESGNFQVDGINLTINPEKSVLEEWSKKGGRDEWDRLLKTQNIALEKMT